MSNFDNYLSEILAYLGYSLFRLFLGIFAIPSGYIYLFTVHPILTFVLTIGEYVLIRIEIKNKRINWWRKTILKIQIILIIGFYFLAVLSPLNVGNLQ